MKEIASIASRAACRRKRPLRAIGERRLRGQMLTQSISEIVARELAGRRARLERAAGVLRALNPEAILTRGYTITMNSAGHVLTSAQGIKAGLGLRTRFQDGEVESIVKR